MEHLVDKEEHDERPDRHGDFLYVVRDHADKGAEHLPGIGRDGVHIRGIGGTVRGIEDAENENGEDRTDGAERDQTKAVVSGLPVGTDRGHTNAKSHNKRHCHRTGSHTARVKGDRLKRVSDKGGQDENDRIEDPEQDAQRYVEQDT